MKSLIARVQTKLRCFRQAREGNVAVTFALAVIPIVGFVGAAVDYSHANSIRSALQATLESTALMLSKDAATLTTDALKSKANAYFSALFNRPEATLVDLTPTYTDDGGSQLTLTAKVNMKTNFMSLMNIPTMDIGAASYIKWGNSRLRVALALDNTGSMSSASKMTNLKTATTNLLDQLKTAATKDGDVYVSIIPFSKDVNVGTSNKTASWLDWSDWDEKNGKCSKKPWHGSYDTKSECDWAGGNWNPDNHNNWTGCVTDRDQDFDVKSTTPTTGNTSTLFVTEQYDSCPVAIMGQTYDWTALKAKVNAMTPDGATNQTIGLAWAWQSLTTGDPLNPPAKDGNYTYQDVIILLSDGLNTQDRWYGNGYNVSSQVDARMEKVCANAKAANMTIYTVQVATDGDPLSTVLQNCASDTSKFFYLTTASAIVTTFNQIGTNLSKLRIAK